MSAKAYQMGAHFEALDQAVLKEKASKTFEEC